MTTYTPWRPSKAAVVALGLLAIWPPIYLLIFMGFIASTFANHVQPGPGSFMLILPLHLLTMLINFGLMAAYIIHAVRNDQFSSDQRLLWVVLLFLGNMLAFPIYWWLHLRPTAPAKEPLD